MSLPTPAESAAMCVRHGQAQTVIDRFEAAHGRKPLRIAELDEWAQDNIAERPVPANRDGWSDFAILFSRMASDESLFTA
jgi:hypothetical protein